MTVEYQAAALPVGEVAAKVYSSSGATVIPGARVTLLGRIADAGIVQVGSLSLKAAGVVRRVALTGEDGVVRFPAVPMGTYDLVVEPLARGGSSDATTRTVVNVPTGLVTMQLLAKVALQGTLQRPPEFTNRPIAGSKVRATFRPGPSTLPVLGSAPITSADAQGAFDVRVDPLDPGLSVEYVLVADPPSASGLGRAMRVVTLSGLGSVQLPPLSLPRGLLLRGVVRPESGVPLAGVYIEAHRYRMPGHEDPAPRAEAISDEEGRFTLILGDPDDLE